MPGGKTRRCIKIPYISSEKYVRACLVENLYLKKKKKKKLSLDKTAAKEEQCHQQKKYSVVRMKDIKTYMISKFASSVGVLQPCLCNDF